MRISPEWKIGTALTLIFAIGAGAIMVFPAQIWIGWATIVLASAGLVLLGVYHFWGDRWTGISPFDPVRLIKKVGINIVAQGNESPSEPETLTDAQAHYLLNAADRTMKAMRERLRRRVK